jgi:outer membrane protein TolC
VLQAWRDALAGVRLSPRLGGLAGTLTTAAVALMVFVAAASGSAAEVWPLERCVAAALERHPDARAARARVDAARSVVDQAESAWKPQVMLGARYTQTDSPMMAFGSILNQRAFTFALDFNDPGRIDNLNATGTIAYNLYSGGRATAGRNAARAGVEAAGHDLTLARQQLAAEVVRAALNVHKAREAVIALEGGLRAYDAAVAVAEARHAAGQMLKSDLLALHVLRAGTRESLGTARHGATLALLAFRFAIGFEPSDPAVEPLTDDPVLTAASSPDTGDFSRRPELLGLAARLRAAEAMATAARGGHRPTVNAFASVQHDQGWETNRDGRSWLAGVSVDVNVFDGGQTSARIRRAEAELAEVRALERRASLGIGLEVEQARLAHLDALERVEVSALAATQAEEAARLSRLRFEKESLLAADLIGAEGRLLEARLRHVIATADERIALVSLRRALGLDPLPQP